MGREGVATMDLYIRMNGDSEKDYCFAVERTTKVKDLVRIFEALPLVLCPNYFYDTLPEGFAGSVHPGYLTTEGCLLFDDNADLPKYLQHVDQDATVWEVFVEGQLVVPIWTWNSSRYMRFVSFLMFWLYLDLPQHWSPTPGYAPTVIMLRIVRFCFPIMRESENSVDPMDTDWWRYGFFFVHILKIGFIYLLLKWGVFKPRTLNPWKARKQVAKDVSRDDLMRLGWTASRRMNVDVWEQKHRDFIIAKHGNIVKTHLAGDLDLKPGITLNEGEGYSVLKQKKIKANEVDPKTLLTKDGRFVVSENYLNVLAEPVANALNQNFNADDLRNYRSYGYIGNGSEELRGVYKSIIDRYGGVKIPMKN